MMDAFPCSCEQNALGALPASAPQVQVQRVEAGQGQRESVLAAPASTPASAQPRAVQRKLRTRSCTGVATEGLLLWTRTPRAPATRPSRICWLGSHRGRHVFVWGGCADGLPPCAYWGRGGLFVCIAA